MLRSPIGGRYGLLALIVCAYTAAEAQPGDGPAANEPQNPIAPQQPIPARAVEPEQTAGDQRAPLAAAANKHAVASGDYPAKQAAGAGASVGSYGRVGVGTDLRASTPQKIQVVAHGPRHVESSYSEIDFYYDYPVADHRNVKVQTVATLAAGEDLFHYTGEFAARIGIRNLYAEAVIAGRAGVWIGSRMVRGDDIYLLDFWPLDDSNIVGAGAWYQRDRLAAGLHLGENRLRNEYQYQQRDVPNPEIGTATIAQLDRQRMIAGARGSYRLYGPPLGFAVKAKLYAEVQALPHGSRLREDRTLEALPSDLGWTLGAQLGAWSTAPGTHGHGNLFVRWSRGLAAFDELAAPTGFAPDMRVYDASEFMLGLSGNADLPFGGVGVGAYARRFVDADGNATDRDDGWEYAASARPYVNLWRDSPLAGAIDVSYQKRFPRSLSAASLIALDPAVFQIAPMMLYSPLGSGFYRRPQFRLLYRGAHLNEGARDQYPLTDPRRNRAWVHYLGVQVEWWFHSTYR